MNIEKPKNRSLGITQRTALLSWLVTTATVVIFALVIIPMQQRTFLENLESKAHSLAVSVRNLSAGSAVNEDFSTIEDQCLDIFRDNPSLKYIVIAKNKGDTFVNIRNDDPRINVNWSIIEPGTGTNWQLDVSQATKGIGVRPFLKEQVYFYSMPFDYSGIQWGSIEIGISGDSYQRSVATVYRRTGILAVVCILISLVASVLYAKHLVRPILNLRQVVRQVAGGNLAVRATEDRGDELGSLAGSVNAMTESLRRRDLILESMRFAAQKFLSTSDWEKAIAEVLGKIGEADNASRVHVLQKEIAENGKPRLKPICEWVASNCPPFDSQANRHTLVMLGTDLDVFLPSLEHGRTLTQLPAGFSDEVSRVIKARRILAFIVIPIMVEGVWWGILSLVDCVAKREWTDSEKDSFRAIADMFGAAIERQNIQNALVAAKESAESASQAKSQFLANMSHEIRTPITGVLGMLQLLQRTELNKNQARYAANAFTSAKTLLTVIGDVLDFSKIEAGKMELEELIFDPAEVVDTVARLFAERAEGKSIELVYHVKPDVPRQLRGDSNRLRQVLVNLVGNAIKFTNRGEVVLTCEPVENSAETTTLRFQVRDTGCGIAPEKQKLIFDPFSQADNSMTRRFGGTGLGLTISRQFCELMGGKIHVSSAPGGGSTFEVVLHFKNGATETKGHNTSHLRDLRNLRVLIVDDCAVTREINSEWIGIWKGQAESAADAAQALEKMHAATRAGQPFQVAVLDWKMPETDGFALANTIKGDALLAGTGLVLLSSFTQQGGFDKIKAAGFDAFVPKPAGKSDLYDAIITAANGELKKAGPTPDRTTPPVAVNGAIAGRVLLAEDNEINREVATEMLSALGYRFCWVLNGREAVKKWQQGGFDLILMDCQMPEMDGYEATRAIRIEEGCHTDQRHIPIVALTAHATKGDRDRCLDAGMDDYLTKPLDPETLSVMLAKWIPAKKVPDQNTPTSGQPSPIDYPSLLHRCMGKPELALRLMGKFVEQAESDMQAMALVVEQKNAKGLAAAAHRLKGAAANVSAGELRQIASDLEMLGRNGDIANAETLLQKLQAEWGRLKNWAGTFTSKTAATGQPENNRT